jgi:hypothetical protein
MERKDNKIAVKLRQLLWKYFRIVVTNSSRVISSGARNLVLSGKDCHVASLPAMTALQNRTL